MSNPDGRGRPKKKKRGPDPSILGADGDPLGFRNMSVNSKRAYWNNQKEEDLNETSAFPGPRRRTLSDEPVTPTTSAASGSATRGRPPKDPVNGPMRELSLQRRRGELSKLSREEMKKLDYLSKIRKQAVSCRKDRQVSENVPQQQHCQDQDLDPSERTIFRFKADFSNLLPPSLKSQMELLVKIAKDGLFPELFVVDQQAPDKQTPKSSFYRYHDRIMTFLDSSLGRKL